MPTKSTHELIRKYDVPAPRYTSYPTVPYWEADKGLDLKMWALHVKEAYDKHPAISLYIHLPFCESLCTYCGCNKRITKNHAVESPYIDSILQEWALYRKMLPENPVIKEIHLGGGTPTFFHPDELKRLIEGILASSTVAEDYSFSFEAHPGNTTYAHLQTLRALGFQRLSIGIQDFAPEILQIINRHQTHTDVVQTVEQARSLGYDSINFDLIFGLPLQTTQHIRDTIEKLEAMKPERIAFYSYAHVPWIKPSQRAYSEADLPKGEAKRELYELGRNLLEQAGYREIGMDHFALPQDDLCQAVESGSLHRNFMGYTPHFSLLSIGLGVSSISDTWTAFAQNEKKLEDYQQAVSEGRIPLFRGHWLTEEDRILRQHILNLMCRHETDWSDPALQGDALEKGLERLQPLLEDGLASRAGSRLKVEEAGLPFIRNICLALDARYWAKKPEGQLFSQTV